MKKVRSWPHTSWVKNDKTFLKKVLAVRSKNWTRKKKRSKRKKLEWKLQSFLRYTQTQKTKKKNMRWAQKNINWMTGKLRSLISSFQNYKCCLQVNSFKTAFRKLIFHPNLITPSCVSSCQRYCRPDSKNWYINCQICINFSHVVVYLGPI